MRAAIVSSLCVLFTLSALADEVQPSNPTTVDFVRYVVVSNSSCPFDVNTTIDGFDVTIDFVTGGGCTSVVTSYPVDLGFLPAGTYNVTVNILDTTRTDTFVVADASHPVPTLEQWAAAALLFGLAVIGIFVIRT